MKFSRHLCSKKFLALFFGVLLISSGCGGGSGSTVSSGSGQNPVPSITSLSPSSATAGAAAQTITISGASFLSSSTVSFNGTAHAATYVSSTQLTIELTANDQATAGTYPVVVTNPSPGGGKSNAVSFTVNNPAPAITGLSPSGSTAGAAAQTLTINGSGFVSSSTATFNGTDHPVTYVSSSQLTIELTAADQATAGTYPVVVTNPSPGGGGSNSANFTVANPKPSIASLSPNSSLVGSAGQTLAINGSGFVSSATVTFNGTAHAAAFVSATELTIQLTASDQATAGTYPVVVTNPSPGGGTSNTLYFSVQPGGTLSVVIQGLPSGTDANVTVSNSGAFSQNLTQTTTLSGLGAGTYVVTAAIVTSASVQNTVYIPSISGSPASVSSTSTATVNVTYAALSTAWQAIGPEKIAGFASVPAAGKLQAFAIDDANPLVMYAGGGIGPGNSGPYTEAGVYKTTDGGSTWTPMDTGLTDPTVNALWLDQSNPNIVLAGTNSAGIFRSADGGSSWTLTGASVGTTSAFVDVSGTLYAATAKGVATSTDDGSTWTVAETTTVPVRSLASAGGVTYAGLDNGQVLVQASPGGSWVTSSPSGSTSNTVWSIAVNPANTQNAFVVEWYNYHAPDVYETSNEGQTWTVVSTINYFLGMQFIAFDSASNLYAGADLGLWTSIDGGTTWTQVSGANWDVRLIVADAGGVAGNLVVGSDQGLYDSPDGGSTWKSLNGNITSSILYGTQVAGASIFASPQDFGSIMSFNSGSTWTVGSFGGEGGVMKVNPGNPQYVYALNTSGFQYSDDGGSTFASVSGITYNTCGGNGDLIAVDPGAPSTVYVAASGGVYKSTDWGVTWTLQSSWPVSQPVMVAVDPTDSNTIFVTDQPSCGGAATLYVTHDGGSIWSTGNLGGASGAPTSLAVDPSSAQIVVLGMSAAAPNGGILRSTDGGATFSPDNPVTASPRQTVCNAAAVPHIQFDPSGSGVLAAATNNGLYLSSDSGTSWTNVRGTAIPFAFTQPFWSGGYLYASTCGEGVLRVPFP